MEIKDGVIYCIRRIVGKRQEYLTVLYYAQREDAEKFCDELNFEKDEELYYVAPIVLL